MSSPHAELSESSETATAPESNQTSPVREIESSTPTERRNGLPAPDQVHGLSEILKENGLPHWTISATGSFAKLRKQACPRDSWAEARPVLAFDELPHALTNLVADRSDGLDRLALRVRKDAERLAALPID